VSDPQLGRSDVDTLQREPLEDAHVVSRLSKLALWRLLFKMDGLRLLRGQPAARHGPGLVRATGPAPLLPYSFLKDNQRALRQIIRCRSADQAIWPASSLSGISYASAKVGKGLDDVGEDGQRNPGADGQDGFADPAVGARSQR
jgi:hypothetical protein